MKLILIYAKYCPYSIDFLPKFEKMKPKLRKTFKNIKFKTLTKESYNRSKYSAKSFPSLFLETKSGKMINLNRNSPIKRNAENIIKTISKFA